MPQPFSRLARRPSRIAPPARLAPSEPGETTSTRPRRASPPPPLTPKEMDKQAKAAAQRLVAAWYDMSKHMDDATFKAGMDDGKTLYEYVLKEGRFTGRPSASQASYTRHSLLALRRSQTSRGQQQQMVALQTMVREELNELNNALLLRRQTASGPESED